MSLLGEFGRALVPLAAELLKDPKGFFDSSPERVRYLKTVPEKSDALEARRRNREAARKRIFDE